MGVKRVENDFIGVREFRHHGPVRCGDGQEGPRHLPGLQKKKKKALTLNMNWFQETRRPSIVIMNTNKRRELADSKYNERFAETHCTLKEPRTRGYRKSGRPHHRSVRRAEASPI